MTADRIHHISERLAAGWSQRAIADEIGCSAPRVSQIVGKTPALRRLRTRNSHTERARLLAYKSELEQTLHQVQRLADDIEDSLETLRDELSAINVDHALGLRPNQ